LLVVLVACANEPPAPASDARKPAAAPSYERATTYYVEGDLPRAAAEISAAIKTAGANATVEMRLLEAEVHLDQGEVDVAEKVLKVLNPMPQTENWERWTLGRAIVATRRELPLVARALLDEIDRGPRVSKYAKFRAPLLRSSHLIGQGRVDEAQRLLLQTAKAAKQADDGYHEVAALLNLGTLLNGRQQPGRAISYLEAAIAEASRYRVLRMEALATNNLGVSNYLMGELDRAESLHESARKKFEAIGDHYLEDALGELENIAADRGDYKRAEVLAKQATDAAVRFGKPGKAALWATNYANTLIDQERWDEAEAWNERGAKLIETKNPDNFLNLNRAAIATGRGDYDEALRIVGPLVEEKGNSFRRWNAYRQQALIYAKLQKPSAVRQAYENALGVLEGQRSDLEKAEQKFSYQAKQIRLFQEYVALLVADGNTDRALQVVEYSRARVLAERQGRQAKAVASVRLDAFRNYAKATGQTLVSYWIAPRESYAWVVQASGIRMVRLKGRDEIQPAIAAYRNVIEEQRRDPVEAALAQGELLTNLLLKPLTLGAANRILILPDGDMHALNLETLPSPTNPRRYWLEDVEVAIAPGLTLLDATTPAKLSPASSILLVGAPVEVDKDFPALRGAEREIESIRGRFVQGARVVRGAEATPAGFLLERLQQYSMIHFAAHAQAVPANPLESAIILSSDGENYKLYARDIASLKLRAQLVTVSACRSAGARTYAGEGLVGFAWAFLEAGAGSVVAGLWDVSDSSTAELMDGLYEGIAAGKSPTVALREAKLGLLRNGTYRKPYYWAPYQIYVS
jgi:CHAT domain-containing protein/Tfp pilus assembly protein PilF